MCGNLSPDKDGLFIANHWTTVKYSHGIKDKSAGRIGRTWHKKEYCQVCFDYIALFIYTGEKPNKNGLRGEL